MMRPVGTSSAGGGMSLRAEGREGVPIAAGRLRQLPLPMVRLTAATGLLHIGLEMPVAPVKVVIFVTGRPPQLPRRTGRPRHPVHLLHPALPLPLI